MHLERLTGDIIAAVKKEHTEERELEILRSQIHILCKKSLELRLFDYLYTGALTLHKFSLHIERSCRGFLVSLA
jgi:hypothetical protein